MGVVAKKSDGERFVKLTKFYFMGEFMHGLVPIVGTIVMWPLPVAPDGWLLCDGSEIFWIEQEKSPWRAIFLLCRLPLHLLKIQRTERKRRSGGNLSRSALIKRFI